MRYHLIVVTAQFEVVRTTCKKNTTMWKQFTFICTPRLKKSTEIEHDLISLKTFCIQIIYIPCNGVVQIFHKYRYFCEVLVGFILGIYHGDMVTISNIDSINSRFQIVLGYITYLLILENFALNREYFLFNINRFIYI